MIEISLYSSTNLKKTLMQNSTTFTTTLLISALSFNALALEPPKKYVLTTNIAEAIAKEELNECAKSDDIFSE